MTAKRRKIIWSFPNQIACSFIRSIYLEVKIAPLCKGLWAIDRANVCPSPLIRRAHRPINHWPEVQDASHAAVQPPSPSPALLAFNAIGAATGSITINCGTTLVCSVTHKVLGKCFPPISSASFEEQPKLSVLNAFMSLSLLMSW